MSDLNDQMSQSEHIQSLLTATNQAATKDVYLMACAFNDKANTKLNNHLIKEDIELGSIKTYVAFLDQVKKTADDYKLRPPKAILDSEEEEEEKKANEDLNKLEDQYSDQIS